MLDCSPGPLTVAATTEYQGWESMKLSMRLTLVTNATTLLQPAAHGIRVNCVSEQLSRRNTHSAASVMTAALQPLYIHTQPAGMVTHLAMQLHCTELL